MTSAYSFISLGEKNSWTVMDKKGIKKKKRKEKKRTEKRKIIDHKMIGQKRGKIFALCCSVSW